MPIFPFDIKAQGLTKLASWLQEKKITFFQIFPTSLRQLVQLLPEEENYPHLRLVLTGGEPIRTTDIQLFRDYFSNDTYLRMGGGTTEALVIAECFITRSQQLPELGVPMGYRIPDKEISIWDENQQEVPAGEVGEIVVKSQFLAAGYWGHPELTAESFIPESEDQAAKLYRTGDLGLMQDGVLYHRGRSDHQIKVRGYRVEMGEVETILLECDGISTGVVIGRANAQDEMELVAYIVPAKGENLSITKIRNQIAQKLPAYMIPARFVILKEFPVTTAGKISYTELPDPGTERPQIDTPLKEPETALEAEIAQIWVAVLGISPIGVIDHFLELGGHSLLATQIINRLQEKYGIEIPLARFFELKTVAGLAAEIITLQSDISKQNPKILPVNRAKYRVNT